MVDDVQTVDHLEIHNVNHRLPTSLRWLSREREAHRYHIMSAYNELDQLGRQILFFAAMVDGRANYEAYHRSSVAM